MGRFPLCLFAAVAHFTVLPTTAHAGGWVRPAGSVYVRAGAAWFQGEDTFLLGDDSAGRFSSLAAELYSEVGLGQNLEVDLSLRWVDNANDVEGGAPLREGGPEDLEARLEWAPLNGQQAFAFVMGFRQALYERRPPQEAEDTRPQRGPGGTDVLVGGAFGYSFHPVRAWLTADVLLRLRVQNPSSAVNLRLEGGWMMLKHLGAAASVEFQPAFGRDLDTSPNAPAPVPTVLGLGLKLLVPVAGGFGLAGEVMGWPDVLNDGPGYRLAASLTFER